MNKKQTIISVCVSTVFAIAPAFGAVKVRECPIRKPTPASYTWNFRQEANNIFTDIQQDAWQAQYHAEVLQSMVGRADELSWLSNLSQLNQIRDAVNHIGAQMCRLETIRRVLAPWQQRTVDRLDKTVMLMAYNTQDAIAFGNIHRTTLWVPTYGKYVNTLYTEAKGLTHSMNNAVEYAKAGTGYKTAS